MTRETDPVTGRFVDSLDARGYVKLSAPDHPLADSKGRVPRHRLVLFDALFRPDESACELCGYALPWTRPSGAGNPASWWMVNVDHLNSHPGDDRVENLRALCWWCNANRSWAEPLDPEWFLNERHQWASVHPSERPNLAVIFATTFGFDPHQWRKGHEHRLSRQCDI